LGFTSHIVKELDDKSYNLDVVNCIIVSPAALFNPPRSFAVEITGFKKTVFEKKEKVLKIPNLNKTEIWM
jgi:hypothetical protein